MVTAVFHDVDIVYNVPYRALLIATDTVYRCGIINNMTCSQAHGRTEYIMGDTIK